MLILMYEEEWKVYEKPSILLLESFNENDSHNTIKNVLAIVGMNIVMLCIRASNS